MVGYIFKIENNELTCSRIVNDSLSKTYADEATKILKSLDSVKYKKARVTESGILLVSDNTRLYIRDEVLFTKDNYQNCLCHTMNKINKAVIKHNKNFNRDKNVTRGLVTGFATAGIIASIGLAIANGDLKEETLVNNITLEQNNEEYNSEINVANEELKDNTTMIQVDDIENTLQEESVMSYDEQNSLINLDDKGNSSIADDLLFELNNDATVVNMSFNDSFDQVKYEHVYNTIYNDVNERASRWGVSCNLAMSFVSQESGAYLDNLMQVQWNSWKDYPITVFNFEKSEFETIVLTETPEKYFGQDISQTISKEELLNPKTNISIGCIILRYCFDKMNFNMTAAIQAYNFGTTNMEKVLEAAAQDMGCTVDEILANKTNTSFLNYRNIIDVGDPMYVEHVLRFLQNPDEEISIKYVDNNGEIKMDSVVINNEQTTKRL